MNNSFTVGRIQSFCHLNAQIQKALQLHRLAVDQVFQRCAIQIFHADECFASRFADVVNGADVWMV